MRIVAGSHVWPLSTGEWTSPIGVYLIDPQSHRWHDVGSAIVNNDGSVTLSLDQSCPPGSSLHIRLRPNVAPRETPDVIALD